MFKDVSTYRRIVKSTGLFGGVQLVNILCSIIKTKLVAVWLGAEGIGIMSLYTLATETVSQITGLGIRQSGVRDVSVASKSGDHIQFESVKLVVRRWSGFAGLLGAVVTLILAPYLSLWTFGDSQHIGGFVFLSCTLLINALVAGEQAIIQGSGQLRILAKSGVAAAVVSLILSLPLFYYFRIGGLVPSLIIASVSTLLFLFYYNRKSVKSSIQVRQSWKDTKIHGRKMVLLGIYMTVSGFIVTLFNYLFIAWMNARGGMADVGYYQAGYNLMNRYFGLIFTAMGMEFYPRLAAVCDDKSEISRHVSQQAEISMFILVPTIGLLLLFKDLVIRILYTGDFQIVEGYLLWSVPGVLFKAVSWSMGFILLAKGKGPLFLVTEIVSAVMNLALNFIGYKYMGLQGIGIAYTLGFILYMLFIGIICFRMFGLRMSKSFYIVFLISCLFSLGTFGCIKYEYQSLAYILVGGGTLYSLWMLKRRLALGLHK